MAWAHLSSTPKLKCRYQFIMEISLHVVVGSVSEFPYLCLKAFNQDGHQQVEEDVVSKGHEGHKVKSGKW